MKTDGVDTKNVVMPKQYEKQSKIYSKQSNKNNTNPGNVENEKLKNTSKMSEYDKNKLSISEKIVIETIEKANKSVLGTNTKFEFSIHEKTKQIMVKVLNSETNEVIREIPPEKTLDIIADIWEKTGIIIDKNI
jgi:flagellar protein FlaG